MLFRSKFMRQNDFTGSVYGNAFAHSFRRRRIAGDGAFEFAGVYRFFNKHFIVPQKSIHKCNRKRLTANGRAVSRRMGQLGQNGLSGQFRRRDLAGRQAGQKLALLPAGRSLKTFVQGW